MSRAETAMEQLYEDMDIRDELTDEEAAPLLKWAETQAIRLDAESADNTAFEQNVRRLRDLLKSLNHAVGKRSYATPEELNAALEKVSTAAQGVNMTLPASAEEPFQAQGAQDNVAYMQGLLNQLDASIHTPVDEPVSVEAQTADTRTQLQNTIADIMRGKPNTRPDNTNALPLTGDSPDVE
jgi:hypothetical protein